MPNEHSEQAHYFSASPDGPMRTKRIRVTLGGREVEVQTAGSVFSPDHLDTGTRILLKHFEQAPSTGNLLDIGCGWGPIAICLALANPAAKIWAVDVNERSLELTKANVKQLGLGNVVVCKPDEVPAELSFDGIWSNPPIRVGKDVLHEIMHTWLTRMTEGAEAFLVVAKQLGADSFTKWLDETFGSQGYDVERVDNDKGFRVIRVVRVD
ncbi:MAG: hypothetical protein RL605_1122 [Actinomycetota bacterium]|jgi:16S rRNA G1207 methylase RsmC